jgi:hypothetical protein
MLSKIFQVNLRHYFTRFFIKKTVYLLNPHLRHPNHGMIVTNLTRLPFPDLDFSLGAPVNFSTYAEVTSSAAILPAENGVEILIVHPPKRIG